MMNITRKGFVFGAAAAAVTGAAEAEEPVRTGKRDVVIYVSCHPDDLAGSIGTV